MKGIFVANIKGIKWHRTQQEEDAIMINKPFALALMLIAGSAAAADTQTADASSEPAVTYEYGMSLDIKHVISTSQIPDSCKLEQATMVYEDSQGQVHTLNYKVMGGCLG